MAFCADVHGAQKMNPNDSNPDFSSCGIMRSTFVVLDEMSRQLFNVTQDELSHFSSSATIRSKYFYIADVQNRTFPLASALLSVQCKIADFSMLPQ